MNKEGYQPLKTKKTIKIIPPNTGSNVQMKKDGYTWEDLDRSFWEGFDNAKNKMEKRIAELEESNIEWQRICEAKSDTNSQLTEQLADKVEKIAELEKENAELKGLKDVATLIRANNDTVTTLMQLNNMLVSKNQQLTKAKELLKQFLEAKNSEDTYKAEWEAEQFLKDSEVEK